MLLAELHYKERRCDRNTVQVIGDDASVGSRVLPAEDRVEDAPPSASVNLGAATL
jgi:hypothetical protein